MLARIIGLTAGVFALTTAATQAQVLTIPEGTTGLSPLTGRVTDVQQVRIPVSETVTGSETRVTLQFTLQGCLDSLMPVLSHTEVRGQRVIFYVTALNAHHQASDAARCVAIPQQTAQVSVPGIFQRNQIRVVFVGTSSQMPASGVPK